MGRPQLYSKAQIRGAGKTEILNHQNLKPKDSNIRQEYAKNHIRDPTTIGGLFLNYN